MRLVGVGLIGALVWLPPLHRQMPHPQSVISAVRIRTSSWRLAAVASACIRTAGVTAFRTVTESTG